MVKIRLSGSKYEVCCQHCGVWREAEVRQLPCDAFFENYQAEFTCCGVEQTARLAVEKDELDFH